MSKPIESVIQSDSNALLIQTATKLWVRPGDVIMDCTYGKGIWFHALPISHLRFAHDKYVLDGVDFTDLPEEDNSIDVVLFDPPGISKGGRETSGIEEFDDAYGLKDAPKTPDELDKLIYRGLEEIYRVLKPKGRCFVKCFDYVTSAKFHQGHFITVDSAHTIGFYQVDEFIFLGGAGPQPKNNRDQKLKNGRVLKGKPRRQVHSRRAHSFLVILQKP